MQGGVSCTHQKAGEERDTPLALELVAHNIENRMVHLSHLSLSLKTAFIHFQVLRFGIVLQRKVLYKRSI